MTPPVTNRRLSLRNRQRARPLNLALLRRITRVLLEGLLLRPKFDLGLILTGASEMARLNEKYLRHQGPTDVIAFDYSDPARPGLLCGEIFVCVDVAQTQARRFHTTWQSEVVRYVVHGVLHLCGHDDKESSKRRKMKRLENRLLKDLAERFPLRGIGAKRRGEA